jgi:hypothetical protein
MTFQVPLALFGLALLAVPVLVHLFKPRKMRQTPFSSLRWLKQTHQRLSRRIQWHQWLLFLLRAGVVALLVLALARPLLGLWAEGRPTDRLVIVDVGQGMTYHAAGESPPLAKAQELASRLLQDASPGDRTALILAGARPHLVTPPVADAAAHVPALKAARASEATARLSAVLPLVQSLLPRDEGRDAELVFVTDNRAGAWRQGEVQAFLKDLPRPVRVRVVDVGPGASARNGWIADARLLGGGDEGGPRLRVELGCVGEGAQERRVVLTGVAGLGEESRSVTLRPGQSTRVDFKVPQGVSLAGQVAEVRLEPADALPGDDRFFVNLDPSGALRVLLVEPETRSRAGRPVGLYLRAGLEALAGSGRQPLELTGRTASAVSSADLARADVVLLAGVPELSETAVEALEKRVRSGAGLVLFLGDQVKPAFYNRRLYNPLQPAQGLLPAPLRADSEGLAKPGRPGLLTDVRWQHPLLAPLHDAIFGDLAKARCERYALFAAAPGPKDVVLARLDNDVPAVVERPLGAGRVLLFNTSADDAWSDVPRRRSYVPLLDRVLAYLSAGGVRRSFTAGNAVSFPLPGAAPGADVTVLTPGGEKRTPRLFSAGGRTLMHMDDVAEPGIYRVEQPGKKPILFIVNASRAESHLTPVDTQALRAWWSPQALEVVNADSLATRSWGGAEQWPLWPALVLLAGLLLLVETIYVALLCPRVNPTVVGSVVHRRGILRPLNDNPPAEASTAARPS